MSNEKKLREALRRIKSEAVSLADAQVLALEALAATEPEPTGMPELPEPDHMVNRWPASHVYTTNQMRTYGEQCWKAGYDLGKSVKNL